MHRGPDYSTFSWYVPFKNIFDIFKKTKILSKWYTTGKVSAERLEQSTATTPKPEMSETDRLESKAFFPFNAEWTHCMMILSHPYHHCLWPSRINIHACQRASNPSSTLYTQMSLISMTSSIINSWRARQTLGAKRWSPNSRSKYQTKPLVLWLIWRQIWETSIPPSHVRVPTSLRLRQAQLSTQEHMFYVRPLFKSESLVW